MKIQKVDLSKYRIVAVKKKGQKEGERHGKYNARKITVDGILFDSKKEARMYKRLQEMEKRGEISDLKLKPVYLLQERFEITIIGTLRNGKVGPKKVVIRPINYTPDFSFWDKKESRLRIIDCKGVATEVYKVKRKLFDYKFRSQGLYVEQTITYGLQKTDRNGL